MRCGRGVCLRAAVKIHGSGGDAGEESLSLFVQRRRLLKTGAGLPRSVVAESCMERWLVLANRIRTPCPPRQAFAPPQCTQRPARHRASNFAASAPSAHSQRPQPIPSLWQPRGSSMAARASRTPLLHTALSSSWTEVASWRQYQLGCRLLLSQHDNPRVRVRVPCLRRTWFGRLPLPHPCCHTSLSFSLRLRLGATWTSHRRRGRQTSRVTAANRN